MRPNWMGDARRRLLDHRQSVGAWGYRDTTVPAVEPTALAGLGLLPTDPEAARTAATWLTSLQNCDGSLGVTKTLTEPGWPTSYAVLLWAALGENQIGRAAAVGWMLALKGETAANVGRWPMGHDMSLVGWPWVAGTHSWVEPTSLAMLAVGREGQLSHARAREGLLVLRDRAIPTGGWNLGNPIVFGTTLRALPGPTGLALLALARAGEAKETVVAPAIDFLLSALSQTLAPASLGWGLLGLRAWGAAPLESGEWLGRAYDRIANRPVGAMALALLLLAAGESSLDALGLTPRESRITDE